jgi:hypothetical protein
VFGSPHMTVRILCSVPGQVVCQISVYPGIFAMTCMVLSKHAVPLLWSFVQRGLGGCRGLVVCPAMLV